MTVFSEVIASLIEDMALEHAAIMQYMIHGTFLRDVGMTDPVRKIAREEMWHFEWLAEAIRERGGEQALDRAEVFVPASMAESMREDVAAEERALSHYAQTLELIGDSDPTLTRLIERIVDDERHHRATFERLTAEVLANGEQTYAAHPVMGPEDLGVAGPTIGMEYATVLQYLWNKFGCGDCELGEQYFELAVDEMRHMAWTASYLPGLADPIPPPVPFEQVKSISSTAEASEAAAQLEKQAAEFLSAKVGQANNERLRDDLSRILGQHQFHRNELQQPG